MQPSNNSQKATNVLFTPATLSINELETKSQSNDEVGIADRLMCGASHSPHDDGFHSLK